MVKKREKTLAIPAWLVWVIGVFVYPALALGEQPDANMNLHPQVLDAAGVYDLVQFEPNLTGQGVKLALISRSLTYVDEEPKNDYQPWVDHQCLEENNINFNDDGINESGISPHSTAICSILLGLDPNAYSSEIGKINYQGAVPKAELEVTEFHHFLANYVFEQSEPDADILIAAMGSQFEDWWTRGIDAMSEKYGLTVIGAIGNGKDAHDPPLYPAASANAIAVGVVDSVNSQNLETKLQKFALAYPEHSTYGPTIDERCKPDIVAPGNCLVAEPNEKGPYSASGDFTSFSTPVAAGTAALLVQKAKQDPNLKEAFSSKHANSLVKSILLNSAKKLPFWHKGNIQKADDHQVPLDYIQGAGMIDAVGAYQHLIAGPQEPGDVQPIGWDLNEVPKTQTDARLYRLTLNNANDSVITATVAWNKHYEADYPFQPLPEKDANLRLELWAVNPNNDEDHYLLDYSDSDNDNIEHLYTKADPNYTSYEIIILNSGFEGDEKPELIQSFAVAWKVSSSQPEESIFLYDLNADGIVNDDDLYKLFDNWVNAYNDPELYFMGDINSDGNFDTNDFKTLMDNKNRQAPWYKEPQPD
jgi:hypothetical protein